MNTYLTLAAGFVVLLLAYLSPLVTDPVPQRVLWSACIAAAVIGAEGWRRARRWKPGDNS
jgi:hypothetical protein